MKNENGEKSVNDELKSILSLVKESAGDIEAQSLSTSGFRNSKECAEYLEKIGAFDEMRRASGNEKE